jgi:hypothetical protein
MSDHTTESAAHAALQQTADQRNSVRIRYCGGASCRQGRDECAHPDLCTADDDGQGGMQMLAYLLVGAVLMLALLAALLIVRP